MADDVIHTAAEKGSCGWCNAVEQNFTMLRFLFGSEENMTALELRLHISQGSKLSKSYQTSCFLLKNSMNN